MNTETGTTANIIRVNDPSGIWEYSATCAAGHHLGRPHRFNRTDSRTTAERRVASFSTKHADCAAQS